jgi:hypothetical protein
VFVIDAKISNTIDVFPLDKPLDAYRRLRVPLCALLLPLLSTMFEQSRCSTSQFVPLRIESNLKGVKQ